MKIRKWKNPNTFIDYLQTIDNVHENLEDYNTTKKMLTVFADMILDMEANKKLSTTATGLFYKEGNSTFQLLLSHNLISKCLEL